MSPAREPIDNQLASPADEIGMGEPASAERICTSLRVELAALDRLAFTLEVQRLVLEAGRADLLAESGRDVEDALERVRKADLLRAVTVSAVHATFMHELQEMGVAANGYPSLGQIAAACQEPRSSVLLQLASRLKKTLARAMALSEENTRKLAGARSQIRDDELALWAGAESVEEFLSSIGTPSSPEQLLDDIEGALFADEDAPLADALSDLQLQAVTFEAALGVLQSVGCRPLLEFISDADEPSTYMG